MAVSGQVSQHVLEVLQYNVPSAAGISQHVIETLVYGAPSNFQASQYVIEVLAILQPDAVTRRTVYKLLPIIN